MCRLRDKGLQKVTVTTVCGSVELLRKRWMSAIGAGCQVPLDAWLGIDAGVVTQGVLALVCLLNRGSTSFEHAAECLHSATNIRLGKETLRQLCVASGKALQKAIAKGELKPDWTAKECVTDRTEARGTDEKTAPPPPSSSPPSSSPNRVARPESSKGVASAGRPRPSPSLRPCHPSPPSSSPSVPPLPAIDPLANMISRIYVGCDGVLVPLITHVEKQKRRAGVLQQRRVLKKGGRKLAPLAPFKPGTDQSYKEFKLSVFYSPDHSKRLVSITSGDRAALGRILKRDASRLQLNEADEALGIYDGGPWIDRQMGRQHLPLTDKCLDFYHLKADSELVFRRQADRNVCPTNPWHRHSCLCVLKTNCESALKTTSRRPAASCSATKKRAAPGPRTSPKPSAPQASQPASTAWSRSAKPCAGPRKNRPPNGS